MKSVSFVVSAMLALSGICLSADKMEGVKSFKFNGCEVICLQDTAMRPPQSLFSDTANTGFKQTAESYEGSVNVFLVKKDGRYCLVDAGNDESRGKLWRKLQALRVPLDMVTDIFVTHIHPDHIGGLLKDGKPLFPKASIHIAREEYAAWKSDVNRASLAKYLTPYGQRVKTFEFGDKLPFGLKPIKRAGHTPGHTIFSMTVDGKTANDEKIQLVFVGDILHAAELQFEHPTFCARYDMDPKEAVKSRLETLQMKGLLFGAHFPFPGIMNNE